MTEAEFYRNYLRPALYAPPHRQVYRVEDYGIPDVLFVTNGTTIYLELKVLDHLPTRKGTPFRVNTTVEQRRTLNQINATVKGVWADHAYVLVAVTREKKWFLIRADAPTEIEMSDLPRWTVSSGTFDELAVLTTL